MANRKNREIRPVSIGRLRTREASQVLRDACSPASMWRTMLRECYGLSMLAQHQYKEWL